MGPEYRQLLRIAYLALDYNDVNVKVKWLAYLKARLPKLDVARLVRFYHTIRRVRNSIATT